MNNGIPIARTLRIRECGFDEYWLQDQIAGNPACLGLGELEVITRERQQSSGGRLDILMKAIGNRGLPLKIDKPVLVFIIGNMTRPLRKDYEGAVYHIIW